MFSHLNVKVKLFKTLGVRSLANASRARQFNPLNPPGVGWVPLPQTNMAAVVGRARSCVVGRAHSCVVVRVWSVMCGRSCVVVRGRAWSCMAVRGRVRPVMCGRARSCVRGRACVRGRSFVVIRGRTRSVVRGRARSVVRGRSCVVVPFCLLRGQHGSQHCRAARFAASTAVTRTNELTKDRTNEQHLITP